MLLPSSLAFANICCSISFGLGHFWKSFDLPSKANNISMWPYLCSEFRHNQVSIGMKSQEKNIFFAKRKTFFFEKKKKPTPNNSQHFRNTEQFSAGVPKCAGGKKVHARNFFHFSGIILSVHSVNPRKRRNSAHFSVSFRLHSICVTMIPCHSTCQLSGRQWQQIILHLTHMFDLIAKAEQ